MRYRKKPVIVEAIPVIEACQHAASDWSKLPKWVRSAYDKGQIIFTPQGISLQDNKGAHIGSLTDMLMCGVEDELYFCPGSVFEKTYGPVSDDA